MTNPSSPWSGSPAPAASETPAEFQRRNLELQLIRIRNEAAAARLEARAAEIELMIRQLGSGGSDPGDRASMITPASSPVSQPTANPPVASASVFASWNDVRAAMPIATALTTDDNRDDVASDATADDADSDTSPSAEAIAELDSANSDPSPPRLDVDERIVPHGAAKFPRVDDRVLAIDEQDSQRKRSRPAAWLVSAIAHLAVLLLLAAIGLQTRRPHDQVALSASTSEANAVSMETFTIESSEPEIQTDEPAPTEADYELSPVGEIMAADFAPDAIATPAAASLTTNSTSSLAAMSLKSESDVKTQFCGVEGGGNHFVYLVDSSASMGAGFESARAELLRSIDLLKADQRFYVVFFDAQPDYMRLSDLSVDEPRSVNATAENKAALKRWAMRITKDRGKAPYDPLRFALNLKPDVVFLLSDGEFPQGIEELLQEENKVENLFGDRHPISIVHTISYYSQEGESRMRRIAAQNNGQYRYIPQP